MLCRVALPSTRDHGFSLVELMVLLVVVGILTVVSFPALLGYWRAASADASARQLASVMNLGRQLAISRKTSVCVDVSGASVRLRLGHCDGPPWTGPVTDVAGSIRIADPATLEVSSNARVTFTALGAAAPSATYTLRHTPANVFRSVVIAASGRISVE